MATKTVSRHEKAAAPTGRRKTTASRPPMATKPWDPLSHVSTGRGTPEDIAACTAQHDAARRTLTFDLRDIRHQCDVLDAAVRELLLDLVDTSDPEALRHVAMVAEASFSIRGLTGKPEGAETP